MGQPACQQARRQCQPLPARVPLGPVYMLRLPCTAPPNCRPAPIQVHFHTPSHCTPAQRRSGIACPLHCTPAQHVSATTKHLHCSPAQRGSATTHPCTARRLSAGRPPHTLALHAGSARDGHHTPSHCTPAQRKSGPTCVPAWGPGGPTLVAHTRGCTRPHPAI